MRQHSDSASKSSIWSAEKASRDHFAWLQEIHHFRKTCRGHNFSPCLWIAMRLCMHQDMSIPEIYCEYHSKQIEGSRYMIKWNTIYSTFVWDGWHVPTSCASIPLRPYGGLIYEVLWHCATAQRNCFRIINLECGEDIWRPYFMTSRNPSLHKNFAWT